MHSLVPEENTLCKRRPRWETLRNPSSRQSTSAYPHKKSWCLFYHTWEILCVLPFSRQLISVGQSRTCKGWMTTHIHTHREKHNVDWFIPWTHTGNVGWVANVDYICKYFQKNNCAYINLVCELWGMLILQYLYCKVVGDDFFVIVCEMSVFGEMLKRMQGNIGNVAYRLIYLCR